MATTFTNFKSEIGATRTLAYSAPVGAGAIIFAGSITNYDATKASHTVTFEVLNGATYSYIGKDMLVGAGAPLKMLKIVLQAGEHLYLTADAASKLAAFGSVVEGL